MANRKSIQVNHLASDGLTKIGTPMSAKVEFPVGTFIQLGISAAFHQRDQGGSHTVWLNSGRVDVMFQPARHLRRVSKTRLATGRSECVASQA
jgi:hypothetical protein